MQKVNNTVERAKEYIRTYYQKADLSEEKVSRFIGMTPISFSNAFRRSTGQTYISYLREVRMEEAAKLLCITSEKTYVIAKKVGMEDPNYFSFLFKKQYGISPSQYREKNGKADLYGREKKDEKKILVKSAKKYIHNHYQNSHLSEKEISEKLNISRIYFSSLFRKMTGQTYVSYLREVRMKAAAELLLETEEKTCVIAEKVGFEDCNYFSFAFKKYYGISPSQYRENEQTDEVAC